MPVPAATEATGVWSALIQPRHAAETLRSAAWMLAFLGVGMTVATVVRLGFHPDADAHLVQTLVVLPVLGLAALALRTPVRHAWVFGVPLALTGTIAMLVLHLNQRDASVGAQALLLIPAMFVAYNLRPAATVLMGVVVLACQQITAWAIARPETAFMDAVFTNVVTVVALTAIVLARNAQDAVEERLERAAYTDPVTGLHTRPVVDEALHRHFANPGGQGMGLVIVDLDHFKEINDRYGHPAGDAALVHVARVLRSTTRPGDLVARLGGDEMAVVIPDCPAATAVDRAAGIVAAVLSEPVTLGDELVALSASAGVAHAPGHAADTEQLYTMADRALYAAKAGGRGRAEVPR